MVVRAEQHLEPVQAPQVIRQFAQAVAAQVEDFQAVGQIEDFPWEVFKLVAQIEPGNTCQSACLEVGEGVHEENAGPVKKRPP
ncbi:hypothetical protein D9M71_549510 [compost metagenome]